MLCISIVYLYHFQPILLQYLLCPIALFLELLTFYTLIITNTHTHTQSEAERGRRSETYQVYILLLMWMCVFSTDHWQVEDLLGLVPGEDCLSVSRMGCHFPEHSGSYADIQLQSFN